MVKLFRQYGIIKSSWIVFMVLCVILSIFGMIISLYEPMILGEVIDNIADNDIGSIYYNMILYAGCAAIGIITVSLCRYILNYINLKFICKLRIFFYNNVISANISSIQEMSSGDLISKFEADIGILSGFISENLVVFFVNTTSIFVISYYMLKVDVRLTLLLLFLVPIDILVVKILGESVQKYTIRTRKVNSEYIGFFEESVNGIKDIKSFESEKEYETQMKQMQDHFADLNLKVNNISLFSNVFNKFFLVVINIIIILSFISSINTSAVSVGIFVAFVNYTGKLYSALFGVSNIYTKWKTANVSLERIMDIFSLDKEEVGNISGNVDFSGDIVFQNVSFDYPSGKKVLKDFYSVFETKRVNILTGTSGCGKTTLCELLLAFYDIGSGDIIINSTSMRQLSKSDLRSRISYVSQTTYFFDMNIFDYLKVGNSELTTNDAAHILNLLGLSELSNDILSNNFPVKIKALSAGQKQRLNIARGLIKKADIYIFDEPTSALDSINKNSVLEVISGLVAHATVIIITHDEEVFKFFHDAKIIEV